MTLEQKAEEYVKNNCCEFCVLVDDCKAETITCFSKECFIKGYEQGKKDYITNDRSYVIPTKEMSYLEIAKKNAELIDKNNNLAKVSEVRLANWQRLEKENEQLKKDKEYFDKVNNEQTEVILKLNEQIEKMKNCFNCARRKSGDCVWLENKNQECKNLNKWELAE